MARQPDNSVVGSNVEQPQPKPEPIDRERLMRFIQKTGPAPIPMPYHPGR